MKRLLYALALLALAFLALFAFPTGAVLACDKDDSHTHFSSSCCDPPARWASRHDARDARIVIETRDGGAALLLTDEVAAMQLSDRTMRKIHRKLRDEQREDDDNDNALGHAIKLAVLTSVRSLLDHSAECSIRDLRDVDYKKGRLVFISEDGDRLFKDVEVNDEDVMSSFDESDAKAFVREFRRVKAQRELSARP